MRRLGALISAVGRKTIVTVGTNVCSILGGGFGYVVVVRSVTVDLGGASPGELVEATSALVSELAGRPVVESAAVCMELAESLGRVLDVGEGALAGFVGVVDRGGEVRRWGFASTGAWLRGRLGMRPGRAGERVMPARQMSRLPLVGKLLAGGGLSYGYAVTIAGAVHRLNDE